MSGRREVLHGTSDVPHGAHRLGGTVRRSLFFFHERLDGFHADRLGGGGRRKRSDTGHAVSVGTQVPNAFVKGCQSGRFGRFGSDRGGQDVFRRGGGGSRMMALLLIGANGRDGTKVLNQRGRVQRMELLAIPQQFQEILPTRFLQEAIEGTVVGTIALQPRLGQGGGEADVLFELKGDGFGIGLAAIEADAVGGFRLVLLISTAQTRCGRPPESLIQAFDAQFSFQRHSSVERGGRCWHSLAGRADHGRHTGASSAIVGTAVH